ncbi:NTP transferase domain-containing protein [Butyrivibrio sp. INlla16]|uniref:acylneuraminate cytidylyltransferase family protein n=1 Tax=Butyrivibrio sp. INlla16 TaxID=1520807 RepID=UPI00088B38EF|nr:NTP transferase domain-containing protein [Butyrivibrio sp. INlla16]SDB09809.1 CMP-N-acetylneuraminic acid synthetase [Butyrivibrio sp. INlla16]
MKVVAFVPIKLNSQRLANKNLLPLKGHPLCWHICNTLRQVNLIDEVYVYCSNADIKQYIPADVSFLKRDSWLDGDTVKGFDIYKSFISEVDADVYILAHTTSPFIKKETINDSLQHILNGENDSAFSAKRIQTFAWYDNKPINYDPNDVPRTQDMEPVWEETSGFYIFKKEIFTEHHRRIGFMPYIAEVKGAEAVDIDEKEDYEIACLYADKEESDE